MCMCMPFLLSLFNLHKRTNVCLSYLAVKIRVFPLGFDLKPTANKVSSLTSRFNFSFSLLLIVKLVRLWFSIKVPKRVPVLKRRCVSKHSFQSTVLIRPWTNRHYINSSVDTLVNVVTDINYSCIMFYTRPHKHLCFKYVSCLNKSFFIIIVKLIGLCFSSKVPKRIPVFESRRVAVVFLNIVSSRLFWSDPELTHHYSILSSTCCNYGRYSLISATRCCQHVSSLNSFTRAFR